MTKIAFICVENACRSQMAEGFARELGTGQIKAFSAGSKPAKNVSPFAVAVMKEKGIDISSQRPKSLLDIREEFDYVVTMGCEDICPAISSKKIIQWDIPDPKMGTIEDFRKVRDIIEEKVKALLQIKGSGVNI